MSNVYVDLPLLADSSDFTTQILAISGSLSGPSYSFTSETNTGWLLTGTHNPTLAVDGQIAVDVYRVNANTINFGFGAAASTAATNPLGVVAYNAGPAYFQYGNTNEGSLSSSIFQITNGSPSAAASLSLENHAYTASGYLAGACVVSAGPDCSPLFVIGNENTSSPTITFLLGGRASTNVAAILSQSSLTLSAGISTNMSPTQTTLTATGTAVCNMPFQGALYKKVMIYFASYTDTATQTFTYPTAFTHTPFASGLASAVAGATVTTTTVTFAVTGATGFYFLEGF